MTERKGVPDEIVDPLTYTEGVPYGTFARLRNETPVAWCDGGFWAVFAHADVKAVLRDAATFSSHVGATQIRDHAPDDLANVQQQMLNMDPPGHSRLRRILGRAFTPKALARIEDRVTRRAAALVDAVDGRRSFDFVGDLAGDLPLFTLAELLGMPDTDRDLLYDWSNRVIGFQDDEYAASDRFDPAGGSAMARRALAHRVGPDADGNLPDPRSRNGLPDLYAYAHELAEHRRRHPGEDVMSLVLEDGGVTTAEFENLFWLFAVAGNETLRNGMPGGMSALLQHPEQYARLRADPALIPTAVEEMLRWWPPVLHFRRTATRATRLGGVDIAAGDKVVVFHASANRDEQVFPDPDAFLVDRTPNDHVSFGFGPHFCLGARLARTQMRALFTEVLGRLGELRPAGEPVRLASSFQNGVKHLPVEVARAPDGTNGTLVA
jgi:cytochrome P450